MTRDLALTRCYFCRNVNVPKRPADLASACVRCGALTRSRDETDVPGILAAVVGLEPSIAPEVAQLSFVFAE